MDWRSSRDSDILTGAASFVGDLTFPGMLHAAFLRSPHPHATIRGLDVADALGADGAVAVFTAADIDAVAKRLQRTIALPALPADEVYFGGQAIAMVVAEDRYLAEDALDMIAVDYEPLPAVTDPAAAADPAAPRVDTARDSNVAARLLSSRGDIGRAFADAELIVRRTFTFPRAAGHPLECRGLVALSDPSTGGLLCWAATQRPHMLRDALADGLGLSIQCVRVITPAVGGGFGIKSGVYPEDLCVGWAARVLGRPVKWLEDRTEHFAAAAPERAQVYDVELAARGDGAVLGLRARILHDQGSHVLRSPIVPENSIHYLPGTYHIPAYDAECLVAFTNKVSTGPYRGAGWPTANFVIERLMDFLADELSLDRAAVRRRNLIRGEQMPYNTHIPLKDGEEIVYDSGDFPALLQAVVEAADTAGFAQRRAKALERGRNLGRGVALGLKGTGTHFEEATVTLDNDGHVWLYVGVPSQGQDHEGTFAQLCARELELDPEDITVVATDTAMVASGWGTNASRSAPVGGPAVAEAARKLLQRIMSTARVLYGVDEVVFKAGQVLLPEAETIALGQLMRDLRTRLQAERNTLAGSEPLLPEVAATGVFSTPGKTFSSAAYYVEVEVDPETCRVFPQDMVVAYDCGRVIDERVVEGQIHGGISYGVSMALLEELVHAEDGQLLTASFADYFLPDAATMPRLRLVRLEYPSGCNPEGFKGVGELGAIGPAPAIAAAVEDALQHRAALQVDCLPISPDRLHAFLAAAERQ